MGKQFTSDYQPPNYKKAVPKRNFLTNTLKKFTQSDHLIVTTVWSEEINGVSKTFTKKIDVKGENGERIGELIAGVLIEKAIKGEEWAIKIILERTDGPVNNAKITMNDKGETIIILPPLDEDAKSDPPAGRISD